MEKEAFTNAANASLAELAASMPSTSPTSYVDPNATVVDFAEVEIEHETDAITVLLMNVTIIGCLLLAYYVRQHKIYHLPERYVMCETSYVSEINLIYLTQLVFLFFLQCRCDDYGHGHWGRGSIMHGQPEVI